MTTKEAPPSAGQQQLLSKAGGAAVRRRFRDFVSLADVLKIRQGAVAGTVAGMVAGTGAEARGGLNEGGGWLELMREEWGWYHH